MKLSITLLGLSALSQVATAELPIDVSLPIKGVTLYEDRALVDRTGKASLKKGINQLRVSALPVSMSEPSLRASVGTGSSARILSVSTRTEEKLETQDERLRALEKIDDDFDRSISKLNSRLKVIGDQESYLNSFETVILQSLSERTTLGTVNPQEISSTSKFLSDKRTELAEERRTLSNELADLRKKKQENLTKVRELTRPNKKTVRYAEISITSPSVQAVNLGLSYLISNAQWKPRYEAHLTDGKLEVQYLGEVRQRTGEDWKDVEVTLSTARPSLGAIRPQLVPLRMYLVESPEAQRKTAVSVAGEEAPEEALQPPVLEPTTPSHDVKVTERGTSVVFKIPGTSSVPSDRRSYKLPIMSFTDNSPTLSFEATPKLLRYVYLKGQTMNKTRFPLLAGPVDIFRQSGFMGTASLKFVAPGKNFDLSFGIDEDLKIIRKRDPELTSSKKSGRKVIHRFAFDTEVANYKDTPQTVTVVDNFPVSDLEEVEVAVGPINAPTRRDDKKGHLEWDVSLKPGEKRTIHLEYVVTLPKDFKWQAVSADLSAAPRR